MAAAGEGVKYVLVIDPKVSWANAPELPEEEEEPKAEDVSEKGKKDHFGSNYSTNETISR